MNKYSVPFAIKVISLFYFLIAIILTGLFIYTYITVPMTKGSSIAGILLGIFLGASIFFLGLSLWRGFFWARMIVLWVSSFVVIVCLGALIFGKFYALTSIVYIISVLLLNGVILRLLLMKKVSQHFKPRYNTINAISREIKKIYEKSIAKHRSANKE